MVQVFNSTKLSKAIKTKRVMELGVTYREAAKKIKIGHASLSRIEKGTIPEMTVFLKVCNWLNVHAGEFITTK